MRPWVGPMLLAIAGCQVPAAVDGCGPVRIVEVMTAGESALEPLPWTDKKQDFIELRNVSSGGSAEDWDLVGQQVRLQGSMVEAPLPPLTLAPGGRALLVAATYLPPDDAGAFETHEAAPEVPWTMVFLDMNNDRSAIDLLSPEGDVCQPVELYDQHAGMSISFQDEGGDGDPWCMTWPTPGAENEPCIDA